MTRLIAIVAAIVLNAVISDQSAVEIQFNLPDLSVDYHITPTKSVRLEAFKVQNRTSTEAPRWVSLGYPSVIKRGDGQFFSNTPEFVKFSIKTLDQGQKEALLKQARRQYPDQQMSISNINLLPISRFECAIRFTMNSDRFELRGSANSFDENPTDIKFSCFHRENICDAFKQRIEMGEPMNMACELRVNGTEYRQDILKLSAENLKQLGLADRLLGQMNDKFVLKKQVDLISQEIEARLEVAQNYEYSQEEFKDEFVRKMLERSVTRFEFVSIDDALKKLSRYGLISGQKDLSPNEIKNQLSQLLRIKEEDDFRYISVNEGQQVWTNLGNPLFRVIDISKSINFVKSKKEEWKTNEPSLEDQLIQLNEQPQGVVQWQQERWHQDRNRIVPRSLNVARVTKTSLNEDMTFPNIKKRVTDAKYRKMYEFEIVFADNPNNRNCEKETEKRNASGPSDEHIDDTMPRKIQALQLLVQQLNNSMSIMASKTDQLESTLNSKITAGVNATKNDKEPANITCVEMDTAEQGWNQPSNRQIAPPLSIRLASIYCPQNSFIQNIVWTQANWSGGNNQIVLKPAYMCCYANGGCRMENNFDPVPFPSDGQGPVDFGQYTIGHLSCGRDDYYVNKVYDQGWQQKVIGQHLAWVWNARYRCCTKN